MHPRVAFKAEAPDRLQQQFAAIDKNGDGYLDKSSAAGIGLAFTVVTNEQGCLKTPLFSAKGQTGECPRLNCRKRRLLGYFRATCFAES